MSEVTREMVDLVARSLVQELTDGGGRDLSATRLTEMEDEVYGLLDRLGGQMQALLQHQAEEICEGRKMPWLRRAARGQAAADQDASVEAQRGLLAPVLRCGRCRRDFFPSGEGARL